MNAKTCLLLATCSLPILFSFESRADRVAFQVSKGLELTKTFSNETKLTLDDMAFSMNGQEMDLGGMEMTIDSSESHTLTDTYGEIAKGRPVSLRRSFDTLSSKTAVKQSNPMTGDMDQDLQGKSELEGLAVVFTWNDAQGAYDVAFADDAKGDTDLLEGLTEDTDLRCLLPDREVSADEVWDIDLGELRNLMAPGGDLKVEPEKSGDEGGMMGGGPQPSLAEMIGDFEGTAKGTYRGKRDGFAVIGLQIEVSSAKDMTDLFASAMEDAEMPEGMEMEMSFDSVDMSFKIKAEGELLWDLAGGHFHSLELSGDMEMDMDMEMSMSMQGQDMDLSQTMQMSGSFTQKAEVSK